MKKKDKTPDTGKLTGGDILISVLIALAGTVALSIVLLIGGALLFPDAFGGGETADQPAVASQPVRGTLPSRAPVQTAAPTQAPTTEPTAELTQEPSTQPPQSQNIQTQPPAQTQAPAASRAPAGPTVVQPSNPTNAPVVQPSVNPVVPPAQQTQTPSGNQGGQVQNTNTSGNTIYITDTGSKYHYNNNCNGGTYYPGTWDDVQRRNLTPCSRCVLN